MSDLSVFELRALIGDQATAADLQRARHSLGNGYALERVDGAKWLLVGWTGTPEAAQRWLEEDGDPDPLPET